MISILQFGAEAQSGRFMDTKTGDSLMSHEMLEAQSDYISGLAEFELENYDKALELLSSAYIKLPEHGGVNFALADTHYKLGDISSAIYYFKQAVKIDPQNEWYHLRLAEIYRESGDYQAAVNTLEKVVELRPNDYEILNKLAQTYAAFGNLEKANEIYGKMLHKTGSDASIHMQRFQNFRNLNMPDSAIAELEAIRAINPDDIGILHRLSQYYLRQGDTLKAKNILEDAYARNRRDPQTLLLLSDIYVQQANWKRAGKLLDDMVRDTLVDPRKKRDVVEFLVNKYRNNPSDSTLREITSTAVADFKTTNPDFAMSHALAADFYQVTGERKKALGALEETTRQMPTNDTAWRRRVQMLFQEQQYKQVIEVGKKADEQVPDDPLITYLVGTSYFMENDHRSAIDWLKRSAKAPARRSFKTSVYGMLGDTYAAIDNWSESDKAYEQALKYDPENHNALNNYAYYLSLREKNLDKARQMITKALNIGGENPSYLDTAGWVYFKLGDYEKAHEYIKASIDAGSTSAEVYEHMGDVLHKRDQPEEAKKWWQKALEQDPGRTHLKEKINQN